MVSAKVRSRHSGSSLLFRVDFIKSCWFGIVECKEALSLEFLGVSKCKRKLPDVQALISWLSSS